MISFPEGLLFLFTLYKDKESYFCHYFNECFSNTRYCIFLQVGIPLFVTGGIGGVHRHGEHSEFNATYILVLFITNSP